MFATIPILSSSIITWFLCIEIPSFNVEITFNIIYFLYILYMVRPRVISKLNLKQQYHHHHHQQQQQQQQFLLQQNKYNASSTATTAAASSSSLSITNNQNNNANSNIDNINSVDYTILIPFNIQVIMYIQPIIISLFIHIALHHNVLEVTHTRIINIALSIIQPALLMIYCAQIQLPTVLKLAATNNLKNSIIDKTTSSTTTATSSTTSPTTTSSSSSVTTSSSSIIDHEQLSKVLDVITVVLCISLVICIENHPIFDELKSFSSLPGM